jgi:hypothetical protein
MDILQVIVWVGLIGMALFSILLYWDKKSKLKFFCKILKWHQDPKWQESDGFNYYGKCPRCGAKIYQDKDGCWGTRKEEIEEDTD